MMLNSKVIMLFVRILIAILGNLYSMSVMSESTQSEGLVATSSWAGEYDSEPPTTAGTDPSSGNDGLRPDGLKKQCEVGIDWWCAGEPGVDSAAQGGSANAQNQDTAKGDDANLTLDLNKAKPGDQEDIRLSLINKGNANLKICEQKMSVADECCSNPERCLLNGSGGKSGDNSEMAMMFLQTALGLSTAMVPGMSPGAMCGRMNSAAQVMTVVNLYLSQRCSSAVSECKSACQTGENQIKAESNRCGYENGSSTPCGKINRLSDLFEGHARSCMQYDNQSMRLATQAVANQVGAQMAKLCKDQTQQTTATVDPFDAPNCTTPAAVSSAFCQELCNRPGAEVNPQCAGFHTNNNAGLGGNPYTSELDGPGRFDTGIDVDEGTQTPNFEDIQAVSKGINSSSGGGGGGAGLGGSSSDFGGLGSGGGGGYGGGAGYNTKIDRGLASGNGYSTVGGVVRTGSGGGFSGYGGRGAITQAGSKFNLKDFLPDKGKNTKLAARLPQALVADIGPSHTDIFKKVTDRFYQVCLRNALYDCVSSQNATKKD